MKAIIQKLAVVCLAIMFAAPGWAEGLSAQDYAEIQQLYAQYNFAIDSGDAEAYAATFTEDGVFNRFEGQEALKNFIKNYTENMNGAMRRHWNTNLMIAGDGNTAEGKVYLMMLDLTQQPPTVSTTATYNDTLVKTEDGWRFSKRTTKADPRPQAEN